MQITQGDAVSLRVKIRVGNKGPSVNLTGAEFTTTFQAEGGGLVTIQDEDHSIEDQEDHPGWVDIWMSSENSALLMPGKFLSYTVKVVQGEAIKFYHSGKGLTVVKQDPNEQVTPASNIFIGGGL